MTNPNAKVALITGANRGIGYETARQIGQYGYTVLMGARNQRDGEAAASKLRADGIDARPILIDVTSNLTIRDAAMEIWNDYQKLDILINNAGIGVESDGPVSQADVAEVRRLFDVNFFGVLDVTKAMLPLLRKASAARIVNVSSGLGSLTRNSDPSWEFEAVQLIGYNSSKAALNMATVLLSKELRDTGIKVNSVSPGFTATDLNGGGEGAQTAEEGAAASVLAAFLPADGITGGFLGRTEPEPW